MPLVRISLSVVIDTANVSTGTFEDVKTMSEDNWVDAVREYVDVYPEEVLELFQEDELLEQISDNAKIEFVGWDEVKP